MSVFPCLIVCSHFSDVCFPLSDVCSRLSDVCLHLTDVFFPVATFDGATPPVRARLQADDWSSDEHGQKGEIFSELVSSHFAILSFVTGFSLFSPFVNGCPGVQAAMAQFVIENSGSLQDTHEQVRRTKNPQQAFKLWFYRF